MILEPIYEEMFIGFSYGYRPGRSQHDALDALAVALRKKVSWVLDADIRSFFDTIDHGCLQQFIEHRIGDKRMVRLLMKWVRAGVMEEGKLHAAEAGTPPGGIISPLMANIYLHYVFDLWVCQWRKRKAHGEVYVVRYADDVVMGFQFERDAIALRAALAERLAQLNLELHPEKTRVLEFGRYARRDRERRGLPKPETFDFLGFTHIAGVDRTGKYLLHRRTSRKQRRAKLAKLKEETKRRKHLPVVDQHAWLSRVLRGHYRYYAVPTNYDCALQRRSQKGRWNCEQWEAFKNRFPLPMPKIEHPWPNVRFAAR